MNYPDRKLIPIESLTVKSYQLWDGQWFLLTAGDFASSHFNTMTVSWGALGCMWNRPIALVVVRPHRYTYEFIEKYDTFTLSAFPEASRKALSLLGSRSGRDGDKIAASGLTPIASETIAAPGFAEAELILECRKIFASNYRPEQFLDYSIESNYPKGDFHRMYYGEISAAYGTAEKFGTS